MLQKIKTAQIKLSHVISNVPTFYIIFPTRIDISFYLNRIFNDILGLTDATTQNTR